MLHYSFLNYGLFLSSQHIEGLEGVFNDKGMYMFHLLMTFFYLSIL
jgi:hypothetical protein